MAFPTISSTPLDNFNRANETPLSGGGNWNLLTTGGAVPALNLNGNKVHSSITPGNSASYWTPTNFLDPEIYVTVDTLPSTDNQVIARLMARVSGEGGLGSVQSYYRLETKWRSAAADEWQFVKVINGVVTNLGTLTTQDVAAGEKIGFSVIGNVLTAYLFTGGSWTQIMQLTGENSITTTGKVALGTQAQVVKLDDFTAGQTVIGNVDAGTVPLVLTPSAVEVTPGVDANTVNVKLTPDVIEQFNSLTFPTTGILDAFNRANENPLSGSGNWILLTSGGIAAKLLSNQATSSSSTSAGNGIWNTAVGPDTEAYMDIPVLPTVDLYDFRLYGRVNGAGGAASGLSGYRLAVTWRSAAAAEWRIGRIDPGGSVTVIGAMVSQAITAGDKLGFSVIGNTLNAYLYTGGVWTLLFSRTDSTYGGTGKVGFTVQGQVAQIDNFGGGTHAPAQGAVDAGTINLAFTPSGIEGTGYFYSISTLVGRFEICGNLVIAYTLTPPPPTPVVPPQGGIIPAPTIVVPAPYRVVHMRHDGTELGEVFPNNPSFIIPLNKVGSITYDMDLDNPLAVKDYTEPYGTDFSLFRGKRKLMGGMHTDISIDDLEAHTLKVTGQSWEHYLEQEWPFDPNDLLAGVYTAFQTDMFEVVEFMLAVMSALPNSLPLTFNNGLSGHLINFKIDVADTEHILDKITTLSQSVAGFDFEITPDRVVKLYAPRKGTKRTLVLEQGSNIYNFGYMNKGVVGTHTVGYGQTSSGRQAVVVDDASQTKYRRWATSKEFTDIADDTALLTNLTQAESDRNATPHTEFTCKIIPEYVDDIFAEVSVGDTVHVNADISWDVINEDLRVVSIAAEPNDEGDEEVTLGLDDGTISL